jgi:threonine/homoserine/homoserine lactone efflux protein
VPLELLFPLAVFSFVTSITPGPNNMMLLASGVNFGFRRTVPHMLGIGIGFSMMVMLLGLGLGQIFTRFPMIYTVLKYAGAVYLLWLAWKIAKSGPVDGEVESKARPMRFIEAAAFQWINPKAWTMAVSAIATYLQPEQPLLSALIIAAFFGLINLPSVSVWALFGVGMRRFLNDPKHVRLFNYAMALLLIASLWPVLADLLADLAIK